MNRINAITSALGSRGIDGIIVSGQKNIRYLSGFTGSSAKLLIGKKERLIFVDPRYSEQASFEANGFDIITVQDESTGDIISKAKSIGISTLGFESTASYEFYKGLLRKGVKIKSVNNLIEDIRKIKESSELKLIEKAVEKAEKAFFDTKPYIRKGSSEKQIAAILEYNLKKRGCSSLPFDIIVASGKNSSMPHARPTENKIKAGDLVVIDWGGEAGGYFSDMTRTLLIKGRDVSKKKKIFETVLHAHRKAVSSVAAGVFAKLIDRCAREIIYEAGYGDYFGHGTGHGVGLDIHELPRVSRFGKEVVRSGMVFTIEPGVYVPGLGGVRIEDMVLVTGKGCRVLTSLPREL